MGRPAHGPPRRAAPSATDRIQLSLNDDMHAQARHQRARGPPNLTPVAIVGVWPREPNFHDVRYKAGESGGHSK